MKLNLSVLAVIAIMNTGWSQYSCLKGDCRNGYGEALFATGAKYLGEFLNGRAHGLGTMYFPEGHRYSGQWRDQVREGQGRFTFAGGDEYLGAFVRNQMEGTGVMTYANGNVYKGEWRANAPHGKGELTTASGARYAGFFVAGKFEGEGTMWYADGSRYEGAWKQGQREGIGVLFKTDGRKEEGVWENDKLVGPSFVALEKERMSVKVDSSATRNCNLEYCDSGVGEYTYRNGTLYIGQFHKGIPEGQARVYYATGDRYEGGWKNHQPQGRGIMHYVTGRTLGAVWESGRPAQVLFDENYSNPVPNGNPAPDASAYNPAGIKIRAVVVGVAQYTHMPALRFTDDDAYQIYAFLKSPEGGAIPEDQIRLLIDEDASHKAILAALRAAATEAGEKDVLMFYFSGHGVEGAFLPVDFDGHNNLLSHETLREIVQTSKARHKIVIADACHAGSLFVQRSTVQATLEKYYAGFARSKGGLALLLSSKGEEYSLEDAGLRSGIYSHYLIRGLRGPADRNADGVVTVRELHDYLYRNVRTYTAGAQTPLLLGDFDPVMPFGVIRK